MPSNPLRSLYRQCLPEPLRARIHYWRNLARHVRAEPKPQHWGFDYDAYWSQRLETGRDGISYPEIVDICAAAIPANAAVLDIGCGTGLFLQELCRRKPLRAVGVDISRRAVEAAQARGVRAEVVEAGANLSHLGAFEFVTLFEVLEHVQQAESVLANVRRSFPRATVLASVPNTGYIAARLRLLFGRFPRQWIVHPGEHIRFWTLHDFRLMASHLGYRTARVTPLRGSALLAPLLPGLFGEALVFQMEPDSRYVPDRDRANGNGVVTPSTASLVASGAVVRATR
jgi:methionine biosynthesis protein MetW